MTRWDEAACRDADPELFFVAAVSGDQRAFEPAKQWCRRCPIVADCLRYALSHNVQGVWGGTHERQRVRLRADHNLPAPEPVLTYSQLGQLFERTDR